MTLSISDIHGNLNLNVFLFMENCGVFILLGPIYAHNLHYFHVLS